MADINQPTILGYAITPWFIVLCLCIIGAIIFAVLTVLGFSKKGSKEREMLEKAVKNTSNIPVKNIEIPTMDFSIDGQDGTESIADNAIDPFATEGFDPRTEGFGMAAEAPNIQTEGFDEKTEGLNLQTEGFHLKTEGLAFHSATEAFATDGTEAFNIDKTEGFDVIANTPETIRQTPKFCSQCGHKIRGNFCSHCGYQIN